jgi:hypothetical protein
LQSYAWFLVTVDATKGTPGIPGLYGKEIFNFPAIAARGHTRYRITVRNGFNKLKLNNYVQRFYS